MTWIDIKKERPPGNFDVLVSYIDGDRDVVLIARYVGEHELEASDEEFGDMLDYNEKDDTYYAPEGWYESYEHNPDYGCYYMGDVKITHWMKKPLSWMLRPLPRSK